MPSDVQGKRLPQQKRSEETRAKIITAGRELFSEEGFYATNSKRIAAHAGISVGSFYNYFADKKDLLLEVHRLHVESVHDMIAESLSKSDLFGRARDGRELIQGILQQTLELHELSPQFHREISSLIYSDSHFAEMGRREEKRIVHLLIGLLEPQREHLRVDDLEAAAWVLAQSIEAIVHSIKIFGAEIEEERLLASLGDMLHRFLYGDDPHKEDPAD